MLMKWVDLDVKVVLELSGKLLFVDGVFVVFCYRFYEVVVELLL